MKLIHLSDLHLGKRVNDFSMLEDQKYILGQVQNIIDEQKPDAVVIAGDIYDKSIPPVEAIELFEEFLNALVQKEIQVLIISGNHDSAERVSFGSNLMKKSGVYFSPAYNGKIEPVVLKDDYGKVNFYLLPYLKPSTVRQFYAEEQIESYNDAVKVALSKINLDKNQRNILVMHQFVTGAATCASEELYVGGSENVDVSLFDDFDYVAMGHLHGPQKVGKDTVRYSGTLLKYSFSECAHKKSVCIVELGEKNSINVELKELKPLHDMREIKGSYSQIMLKKNYENTDTDDYVHITLTDEIDIPEGFSKLRTVYKNLMKLDYDNSRTKANNQFFQGTTEVQMNPLNLFENFFELQNNKKIDENQKKFLEDIISEIWEAGR